MSAASSHPGVSIAVKLVIATSIVVAATVAITSGYALHKTREIAEIDKAWRDDKGQQSAEFEARLMATVSAQAVAHLLAGNNYADLRTTLDSLLEEQRPAKDAENAKDAKDATNAKDAKDAKDATNATGAKEKDKDSNHPAVLRTRGAPQVTWFMVWDVDSNPANSIRNWKGSVPCGASVLAPKPSGLIYCTRAAPATAPSIIELDRAFSGNDVAQHNAASYALRIPIEVGQQPLGSLWVGISTEELQAELSRASLGAHARVQELRIKLWVAAGMVLLLGIILAMLQAVSMARPIAELSEQATRIAQGDLNQRVPEVRRDELGTLARNFNFMADRIGELLLEQAEKAALEHEMGLARSVQQAMLPSSEIEEYGPVKVAGYCAPASSCGGDWWMHRALSGGRVLIVIGDATGHGIHSAMIAATARGAVEALAALDQVLHAPEQVLCAIDSAIRNVGEHHVLMTAFAAVIDTHAGTLSYANAGQNFPYIVRRGDEGKLEDAVILATAGNPLGDPEIKLEIRTGSRELRAGDLFVAFTDGLVERANPAGHLFGDRRLLRLLRGQEVMDRRALDSLRMRVMNAVDTYAEGEDASDDVTFVLCQFDPPAMPQALRRAGTA